MKRKLSPAELSVEDKLKLLYQLQTVLSEIDRIRTLRGELPLEVEDLEDEVEGLHTRMERTHKEIAELRSSVNALKGDIELANGKINTYKEQLDNVRNNREYDTLNKEIEFQTLEVELCNKKIREAVNAEKQKEELLVASQNLLDERLQDLEEKKNELDEIVAETKADEEKLREKAKNLELAIEPNLLRSFRFGYRVCTARLLWRMFRTDSSSASARCTHPQENHRLRVLRTYPHRPRIGRCEDRETC